MLNQSTLVLEGVTLAQVVELVVEVLVDLASGAVADEQTTEDTHAAHPEDLAKKQEENKSASLLLRTKSTLFRSSVCFRSRYRAYLGIRASLVPLRLPRPR